MAGLHSFFSILGSMRLFDFSAGISGTSTAITCKKNKTSVWQCQIVRHSWLRSKQTSVGLTGNNAVPSWTNASLHTSKHTEVNFKASEIINKSNLCTSGAFSSKYTRQYRPNSIKELCNHHTDIRAIIDLRENHQKNKRTIFRVCKTRLQFCRLVKLYNKMTILSWLLIWSPTMWLSRTAWV